jgi:integrase
MRRRFGGWRKERLDTGSRAVRPFGPVTVAKAYRLLHAIFENAVDDQIVRRNPCRIEGAGREESSERDVVSLPVVFAVADAPPVRYRAMALPATFASMRWGELVGLRRENIDLELCEIRIVETTAELDRGGLLPETPNRVRVGGPSRFRLSWCPSCAGIWSGSPRRGSGAWSSSGRRALRCDGLTSGRSGTPRAPRRACLACLSTICAMSAGH